jgi:C1A family cysteine protease
MKHLRKSGGGASIAVARLMLVAVMVVALLSAGLGAMGIAAGDSEAEHTFQSAPLNPDFVDYMENPPESFYGYIPPPIELNVVEGLAPEAGLPTSFDWRTYGMVTSVKNQSSCGTCWIFGATSALESKVLIDESASYDFSEQSVALCVDRSWDYLYDGANDPCQAGGWGWLAGEAFIKKGAVLDSCNPYNPGALYCDGACVCDSCTPVKKVDGYRLVTNDGSQIDTIKNAIVNQGPMTLVFYYDPGAEYCDPTYGAIYDYYPCSGITNHLISVIGWDDSVPHPNPSHTGTGAWLVKNSWGTADKWAGEACVSDGYFYLAYESSCVTEIAYFEYKDHDPSESLLYWDEAGMVNSLGCGTPDAWMANVYTTGSAGDLTHVDFYTTSSNASYEIYVWDGSFGTELRHQTGSCAEPGYYSIPLSSPLSLGAGAQFTLGVDMNTPGYNYPIPIEVLSPYANPPIQSGVSFIKCTAASPWDDTADYGWNACLRARMSVEAPDIRVDPTEFDVTLPPDDSWTGNLDIHNDGTATLTYDISDRCAGPCVATTQAGSVGSIPSIPNPGVSAVEALASSGVSSEYKLLPVVGGDIEIAYDDGSAEDSWAATCTGIPIPVIFAVCFQNPEDQPVLLQYARFYISDAGDPTNDIAIHVYEQASPTSPPGAELITPLVVAAPGPGWFEVDLSGYGIMIPAGGSFAIGEQPLECEPDLGPYLGEDWASPDGKSWLYDGVWHNWLVEMSPGDLMIRAYVGAEVEPCPWLDENPKAGDVPPASFDPIEVTIDTTGLADGDYYCEIVISNNDPDENPTIVPVHLTVVCPPDIWVDPTEFNVNLPPDDSWTGFLDICNDGCGTLDYSISDTETTVTAPASPGGLEFIYQEEVAVSADEVNASGMTTGLKAAYTWEGPPGNGPAILVYTDDALMSAGNTYVEQALQELGLSYTGYYGDSGGFGIALLTAGPWDLVLVSQNSYFEVGNWWTEIEDYVDGGGTVVIETFDIDGDSSEATTLWATLGVSYASNMTTAAPVYRWQPTHPIFTAVETVPDMTTLTEIYLDDGDKCDPVSPTIAVAGFTASETAGQGALFNGSIVNSFIISQFRGDDDSDGKLDAVELWKNEIVHALAPVLDCPWLDENPKAGDVPPMSCDPIKVTVDTRGMACGDYSADIIISNNDPDENPTIVPVHLTVVCGGICGDVNCSGGEPDMADVLLLWYYVGYPGQYKLCSEWAGDVNCTGAIDMADVLLLWYYVGYPGQYKLNCCPPK